MALKLRSDHRDRPLRPRPGRQSGQNLPDQQRVVSAAFSTDIGVDTDALQVQDGYVWYEVDGITPAHERSLDEVKDQVEADWRETRSPAAHDKANEMLDQLKAGTSLADVAGGLRSYRQPE